MGIFRWLRKSTCNHEFSISEITLTGIKRPLKPTSQDFYWSEWREYHEKLRYHDSIVKRVWCLCRKCNTGYYSTCGLSLPGKLVR